MQVLNFPRYGFRVKNSENKLHLFDVLRKKFVRLTPEEWVRQHVVWFLHHELNFPHSLLNVEKEIMLHDIKKRYDVVAFNPDGSIYLVVECKAPSIKIGQETFDQIARYNLELDSQYLMITNGIDHYFCTMDYEQGNYRFLESIPAYVN